MLTCLIIDEDLAAAEELRVLLAKSGETICLGVAENVSAAMQIFPAGGVDILFIRVVAWDDYQKIAGILPFPPRLAVFLSGRSEKCARFLPEEVDFHLQPPYNHQELTACIKRMKDPFFIPQPLDFFFLRVNCRYRAVPYTSLQQLESKGKYICVRTDEGEYEVIGSLAGFQYRLPISFSRVGRGLLIPQ